MLIAVFGLAGIMISVRALKPDIHVLELLFLRALVGLIVITVIMAPRGRRGLITKRPVMQIFRNLAHVIAQFCVFFAVITIPLAQVTAIEFTIPAMTAALAALTIGEKVSSHRWIGMAVSFVGVLFIVRPGFVEVPVEVLIIIVGALFFSINNVMVKVLSQTDSAGNMVFTMNALQVLILIGPAIYFWTNPEWRHVPWILMLGLSGMIAHYCMSRALQLIDTSVCFPIDFLRLPLIAVIAWLAWDETFSPWTVVGAMIIFGSTYYAVSRESKEKAKG